MTEADVIHSADNVSNHSAIYTKLKFDSFDYSTESCVIPRKANWAKASNEAKDNYVHTLNKYLKDIKEPGCINCLDLQCKDHLQDIEGYAVSLLEAIENATTECLPISGGCRAASNSSRGTPGWSDFVKPFAEDNKFWYSVWLSAGKPRKGHIYEIMKRNKCKYKYAIRRLKRANQSIQNDKFVQGLLQGGASIFQEIKKFRGQTRNLSSTIDNEVGSQNIADHFADTYSELYSKHKNGFNLSALQEEISSSVCRESYLDVNRITTDIVRNALESMKKGKSDSTYLIQSDCLTVKSDLLVQHLTNLLKTFVSHGSVPYFLLVCTLLPLVKDNLADITSSDNYRAIASGSLILKLLDIVIIMLEGKKLMRPTTVWFHG